MEIKNKKLSRENLNKLNRNIEETRRKREDVKKEVIIRTELLETQVDNMSSIEDLKEDNDKAEEEIENELIRTGVIDKPDEREGEQEYQSLLDLFQPRKIESDAFITEISEGKDLSSLHKYNENQRRYYNKDREVKTKENIQENVNMKVNFRTKNIKVKEKDNKQEQKPREPIKARELNTKLEVKANLQSERLKEKEKEKKEPINREKTFEKMFNKLKK